MDIDTINNVLHRDVLTHAKYDKYFAVTPCKSTYLGDYTTTGGLEQMVKISLEYKNFAKKIARHLKGRTLSETVTNIYNFLYSHIQYQADGFDQQLRTPSCSWSSRFEGIDCKSYSVFASAILLNLNIDHSFRKVTQPSQPYRWSHVYVIIHSQGKTFIIDPTKKVNTEVTYIQKEDMKVQDKKLPYYGMHGDLTNSNSEIETIAHDTILTFRLFLQDLNNYGVSKSVTQQIESVVRRSTDSGINPKITLSPSYIKVNQTIIHYGITLPTPQGLGFLDEAVGVFSNLFGPEDRASVLARADAEAKRDISQAMTIANSQGKAAAIKFIDDKVSHHRRLVSKYKSANSKAKHRKIADDLEKFKVQSLLGSQPVGTTSHNYSQPSNQYSTTSVGLPVNTANPVNSSVRSQGSNMSTGKVVAIAGGGAVLVAALTYALTKKSKSNK
ncbi:protein of unknown function [Tenacibaculum sp. 190130A14a]|uniref:Transglutaminase-like domain-containing protein n=1 Tax=Tenacibaculum polynesiense TaxID=3137857 RepID=A0ABM9PFW7_9FLAO